MDISAELKLIYDWLPRQVHVKLTLAHLTHADSISGDTPHLAALPAVISKLQIIPI